MTQPPRLKDDCFLHDRDRLKHDDVIAQLQARLTPVAGLQDVPLEDALGLHIGKSVRAPRNVPFNDNSAVDGYAFNHADYRKLPSLQLGGRIAAGESAPAALSSGMAVRIFTGAMMPPNADTVAMQEDCTVSSDGLRVHIPDGLKPGANRRRSGEDVQSGEELFYRGQLLRPQDIAALASLGFSRVSTYRRLRIAILSTGDELIRPGETNSLAPGAVFDSNRYMLASLCAAFPVDFTDLGIIPDNEAATHTALAEAARHHDVILTTGGASRGDEDHVVRAIDQIGKRHLWQIAIKPGRPMSFGQIDNCVFLGLPGNPVAAFVCYLLYCIPAIRLLSGGHHIEPTRYRVAAGFEIASKKTDRREFLRGWLEHDQSGGQVVRKFPHDGSGLISSLCRANGFIELAEDIRGVEHGTLVNYIPFTEFGIPAN